MHKKPWPHLAAVMQGRKDRGEQPINLSRSRSVIAYKVSRLTSTDMCENRGFGWTTRWQGSGENEWKRVCMSIGTKEPAVNPKPQRPLSGNFKRNAVVTTRERALQILQSSNNATTSRTVRRHLGSVQTECRYTCDNKETWQKCISEKCTPVRPEILKNRNTM